jgi:hypothetical protein
MAPHTRLAAASIVAAFTIVCGPAVLAQTTVEAETWDDAISKIDCKYTSKNADGSFSVTGVIKVHGEVQHNPIINVPWYTAELERKCPNREVSRARL